MCRSYLIVFLIMCLVATGLIGCGTVRTMPSMGSYGSPKMMSGSRLDYHAAREDMTALRKFNAEAPEHPLIDLPFSVLLDAIILPITFSVSAYEFVFGK